MSSIIRLVDHMKKDLEAREPKKIQIHPLELDPVITCIVKNFHRVRASGNGNKAYLAALAKFRLVSRAWANVATDEMKKFANPVVLGSGEATTSFLNDMKATEKLPFKKFLVQVDLTDCDSKVRGHDALVRFLKEWGPVVEKLTIRIQHITKEEVTPIYTVLFGYTLFSERGMDTIKMTSLKDLEFSYVSDNNRALGGYEIVNPALQRLLQLMLQTSKDELTTLKVILFKCMLKNPIKPNYYTFETMIANTVSTKLRNLTLQFDEIDGNSLQSLVHRNIQLAHLELFCPALTEVPRGVIKFLSGHNSELKALKFKWRYAPFPRLNGLTFPKAVLVEIAARNAQEYFNQVDNFPSVRNLSITSSGEVTSSELVIDEAKSRHLRTVCLRGRCLNSPGALIALGKAYYKTLRVMKIELNAASMVDEFFTSFTKLESLTILSNEIEAGTSLDSLLTGLTPILCARLEKGGNIVYTSASKKPNITYLKELKDLTIQTEVGGGYVSDAAVTYGLLRLPALANLTLQLTYKDKISKSCWRQLEKKFKLSVK